MALEYLENLRQVLLALAPSGKDGFEGLMGKAFERITNVPFRLAKSGRQFGIDGKALNGPDAVTFECKRYDDSPDKGTLLVKVAELSNSQSETELWIPCVTAPVPTQDSDAVLAHASTCGVPVLLIDWTDSGLPPLAVILAMAGDAVKNFLSTSKKIDQDNLDGALKAIEQLQLEDGYSEYANRLRQQLTAPTIGLELARIANGQWLESAFNDQNEARKKFGQPLAPGDSGSAKTLSRKALIDPIKQYLNDPVDERIFCIHGDEGCGKSWLLAKAWMELEHKPLTVVMTADDFHSYSRGMDTLEFLIPSILEQTADSKSESTVKRWRTRFARWKGRSCETVRLIVVIDGLNQKPNEDWGRILDSMNYDLAPVGGKLIFTVRTQYYRNTIKRRMNSELQEVEARPWEREELEEILSDAGVPLASLSEPVRESLSNPRLLGIALNLLDKKSIQSLEELNVSRLLFEHMRQCEKDLPEMHTVPMFARELQKHAETILDRISKQNLDDLKAFDVDLTPVVENRFFCQLDNEPTKYTIREEGLALALSFALLGNLKTAFRNKRDIGDEFQRVIEPISALDQTADVVLAALIVSCIGEDYQEDIPEVLIKGFANLQNLNEDDIGAFSKLINHNPHAFMRTFKDLCLRNARPNNFDWVLYALASGSAEPSLWEQMSNEIKQWFYLHSLSPDLNIHHHANATADKLSQEREKAQSDIQRKLQALSSLENRLLSKLLQVEGNLSNLIRHALLLLAQKPLATFAESFINWSFAVALNSDYDMPRNEFRHLLRYNTVDWCETRDALVRASMFLRNDEISSVGRWALIRLLSATGAPEDDEYAEKLHRELTKDREQFKGWRLIENYCEVDPCDPGSPFSTRIANTSTKYAEIDVSKLCAHPGQSEEDLFLEMARPGMARFAGRAAVAKHLELFNELLLRLELPLLYCAHSLLDHRVLVARQAALRIVSRIQALYGATNLKCDDNHKTWSAVQLLLQLVFPVLTAEEQIEALLHDSSGDNYSTNLLPFAKPLDSGSFSSRLMKSVEVEDLRKQSFLLSFAASTKTSLDSESRRLTGELTSSVSTKVRAAAFALIANLKDPELLKLVAESNWQAGSTDKHEEYENWAGSIVLLKAVEGGYCHGEAVVSRIAQSLYPASIGVFAGVALQLVVRKLEQAIHNVLQLDLNKAAPEIVLNAPQGEPLAPYTFTLSSRAQNPSDPIADFKQHMEDRKDENFHKKLRESFKAFSSDLSNQEAHIILEHFDLIGIRNICQVAHGFSNSMYDLFTSVASDKLPLVGNLIVFLASAISQSEPQKAVQLYRLANGFTPFVRYTYTSSEIPLITWALWHGHDHPDLNKLRFERLDESMNNQAIFQEVLAALLNKKENILKEYISSRLNDGRPYFNARALVATGFCDNSAWHEDILSRYSDVAGFVGEAHKASAYAYERNLWAKHWYNLMSSAGSADDYWRYSVLFLKVLDGRFDLWKGSFALNPLATSFEQTLRSSQKQRIKKWATHRIKKLFSDDVPNEVFIRGWAGHRCESLS